MPLNALGYLDFPTTYAWRIALPSIFAQNAIVMRCLDFLVPLGACSLQCTRLLLGWSYQKRPVSSMLKIYLGVKLRIQWPIFACASSLISFVTSAASPWIRTWRIPCRALKFFTQCIENWKPSGTRLASSCANFFAYSTSKSWVIIRLLALLAMNHASNSVSNFSSGVARTRLPAGAPSRPSWTLTVRCFLLLWFTRCTTASYTC